MFGITEVVAANVVVIAPAPTVTEPGAVRVELVFERVTTVPPAGATFDSVTVQVVKAFWPMLAGLQHSDDTPREPRRLTLVVTAVSLRLAVIVAA